MIRSVKSAQGVRCPLCAVPAMDRWIVTRKAKKR